MKKTITILILIFLYSESVQANLFNTKVYANCKYSQLSNINLVTYNFARKDYVKYFAFDNEFFYFKYNILNKNFDTKIAYDGEDTIKRSYGFFNDDKSVSLKMTFNKANGKLRIIESAGSNGYLDFTCEKINKNKLPKSKF